MSECGWCGRSLSPDQERRVPLVARLPAAIAMAFVHGGLWAMQSLARPFCARCRAVLVPVILVLAAFVLGAVVFFIRLWLRLPSRTPKI